MIPTPLYKPYYSGLSGLQLHIPKYLYPAPYQNASRLTYYSTFFNSIEINSSFYKIPMAKTVGRWSNSVHDQFKFTFKLWREITHVKNLNFKETDVALFFDSISGSGDKKGCLLVQFPPSLGKEYHPQLHRLLHCIREADPHNSWNLAVEFRNKFWYHETTYDLLKSYQAVLVIHDIPKSATPDIQHELPFIYLRFHGPTGNYRGSYSIDFLYEYAYYINEWLEEGKTVYLYFNNTMGEALNNLLSLNQLISEGTADNR